MDATNKDQALKFLRELKKELNSKLPGPAELATWVRSTVTAAKADDKNKHLRSPETAFLNGRVLPVLFDFLTRRGFSREQAQQALLNEYYRTMPDISRGSPVHWVRHPFRKMLGSSPPAVYQGWKDGALARSYPDFGLSDPFQHSILFEGKYFASGSAKFAQRRLVMDIYEAFFYRGLPSLVATKKRPAGWKCDYACLLVYDASPKATFFSAWKGLDPTTRRSFWEGANVYVMILGGTGTVS